MQKIVRLITIVAIPALGGVRKEVDFRSWVVIRRRARMIPYIAVPFVNSNGRDIGGVL